MWDLEGSKIWPAAAAAPLGEELKMPYLSAYLDSIGSNFSYGANFGAGGSSIQKTGFGPINFGLQILPSTTQIPTLPR
ncbi:hypothetical protein VIGAN_11047200 [Vigna angularis var. angularis]|uniref:Uncharacterized protein n=1 Tax=Vigna angularis var. angularis TaxID=157739 RepID=A0A0S3T8D8_PHAAN|nr:hypothetical protein VIGAN_11047200 [Vigna angularis var. angularis]